MGFTHYWEFDGQVDGDLMRVIVEEAEVLATVSEIRLARNHDQPGVPPVFDREAGVIRFNGVEEKGRGAFGFMAAGRGFDFCKTQQEPYDVVVMAVLLLLKHHLGDRIRVTSDGGEEDWQIGVHLYRQCFPERTPAPVWLRTE